MDTLLQYLKEVAMLEGQLYTQNQLYWKIRNQADTLGYARAYEEPTLRKWKPDIGVTLFVCAQAGFWISLVISIVAIFLGYGLGNFADLFRFFLRCFPVVFVVCSIGWIFVFDYGEYAQEKKKYELDLKVYTANVEADKQRVRRELELKAQLEKEYTDLGNRWYNTRGVLDTIYGVGIIHEHYHDMVAIASFYDYLDTGRCLSLKGPGGAYATYEEDLRFQRLETKMDIIITKLDEIVSNQRMLASLLREANDTLSRIEQGNNRLMQSMAHIEENADLIEYNTRCTMQSSAVMEHIAVYKTLKNK